MLERDNVGLVLDALYAELSRGREQVGLAAKADPHEEETQLNARAKHTTKLENTAATSQPSQHRAFVCNLLAAFDQAESHKHRERFGSNTMHLVVEDSIHTASFGSMNAQLSLNPVRQRQYLADRAEAADRVQRDDHCRGARAKIVRWSGPATKLRSKFVCRFTPTIVLGPMFTTLGQIVQRSHNDGRAMKPLPRRRPVRAFVKLRFILIAVVFGEALTRRRRGALREAASFFGIEAAPIRSRVILFYHRPDSHLSRLQHVPMRAIEQRKVEHNGQIVVAHVEADVLRANHPPR
mmetsp:Transcript_10783/g.28297  ORF Transcript_10783/g.28297 Transcript_10783/m.28297 type:complete len:294 (-) Transcript_10783:997-1878(-)